MSPGGVNLPDCMPNYWEWEAEDIPRLAAVCDRPLMSAKELVQRADRIRPYLNRMSGLALEALEF